MLYNTNYVHYNVLVARFELSGWSACFAITSLHNIFCWFKFYFVQMPFKMAYNRTDSHLHVTYLSKPAHKSHRSVLYTNQKYISDSCPGFTGILREMHVLNAHLSMFSLFSSTYTLN